jgi:DNA-binding transcriptional LysR family regulator
MEIRELRTLLAVARTRSFVEAAAELGYTQSAISQQIAALEADVGTTLFDRRPVRLTPAGERLVEHASRIVLRIDVARTELAGADRVEQTLRIATGPLAASGLLAPALRAVRAASPTTTVTIEECRRESAIGGVATGALDLALVDGVVAPDSPLALADAGLLATRAIAEAPLAVVFPLAHPLARRASIDLDALADAPWIAAPALLGDIERYLRRLAAARSPSLSYAGGDVGTLIELVAAGHGLAVLPQSAATGDDIAAVPLAAPALVHRVELLSLRSSIAAERLIAELRARSLLR